MYLDITGTFRNINSPVKFTTGFVYMGPRLGAGLARTQTSQSVTGEGRIPGLGVTDRDTGVCRRANVSICNNYSAKSGLDVTDLDEPISRFRMSKSVTVRPVFAELLLQIEIFNGGLTVRLDL